MALSRQLLSLDLREDLHEVMDDLRRFSSIPAIEKVDHWTFQVHPDNRHSFESWCRKMGYRHHGTWESSQAHHISFIRDEFEGHAWRDMIGLSVKSSPTHHILDRGEGLQHGALNILAQADFEEVCHALELDWLTPVLVYEDASGAVLRQRFTKPRSGSGVFFWEFVQRIPASDGTPYSGFDPSNIRDLYTALEEFFA